MNEDIGDKSKLPSAAIQKTLAASVFFSYVAVLLIFMVLIVHATRSKERYFLNPPAGNPIEVFPLSEPNVTPSSMIKWATLAATSAYTIDFYHYQDNIDALKGFFTIEGYKEFLRSLDDSGSLKKIVADNLIQSAVATASAVILQEGPLRGVYTWRIQVPLLITYQGASTSSTQKTIAVSLLVTRVPTDEAPTGIGIAQIVDNNMHGDV